MGTSGGSNTISTRQHPEFGYTQRARMHYHSPQPVTASQADRERKQFYSSARDRESCDLSGSVEQHGYSLAHRSFSAARRVNIACRFLCFAAIFSVWVLRLKRSCLEAGLLLVCGQTHHRRGTPFPVCQSLHRYSRHSFTHNSILHISIASRFFVDCQYSLQVRNDHGHLTDTHGLTLSTR